MLQYARIFLFKKFYYLPDEIHQTGSRWEKLLMRRPSLQVSCSTSVQPDGCETFFFLSKFTYCWLDPAWHLANSQRQKPDQVCALRSLSSFQTMRLCDQCYLGKPGQIMFCELLSQIHLIRVILWCPDVETRSTRILR